MIHFITGGQRSGKSSYAQKLALSKSDHPIYLATSRVWDEDHRKRIELHKASRDERWQNVEEERHIGKLDFSGRTVVLDCITLWLTNFFYEHNLDTCFLEAKKEFDSFILQNMDLILISNEIGLGVHATSDAGRKFTDLQGLMNQYIAERADQVTLMISGIPVKIKG